MLLVIVGAGASYDSVLDRPLDALQPDTSRFPLADELFEPRSPFLAIMSNVPQVRQVAQLLHHRPKGQSVEDVMAALLEEGREYSRRLSQLAAIRFYLQAIIEHVESAWGSHLVPNNMETLVDQIERFRGDREPAMFVTFNYDRLIEHAVAAFQPAFRTLQDYVRPQRMSVIKLHGSIDWVRPFDHPASAFEIDGPWGAARIIAENISRLRRPGDIQIQCEPPNSLYKDCLAVPAIAVPLRQKAEFQCPPEHVAHLRTKLMSVRAILTIGWRGAEEPFLQLLRENTRQLIDVLCVAKDHFDAAETVERLGTCLRDANFKTFSGGFSRLISERGADALLRTAWTGPVG